LATLAAPLSEAGPLAAGGEPGDEVLVVPTTAPAVTGQLLGMAGYLQGYSFRETGATVGANQEKSASTVVGAAISVTLTDTAGEQTFITGFDVTLGIAAAAAAGVVTVTGLTNQLNYDVEVSTTQTTTLSIRFPQPLPGAAITVSVPAIGGAAANNAVQAYGTDSASVQAVLELWDGNNAAGVLLACISIAPGGSATQSLLAGKLPFRSGLFINVVSGSAKGAVYVLV